MTQLTHYQWRGEGQCTRDQRGVRGPCWYKSQVGTLARNMRLAPQLLKGVGPYKESGTRFNVSSWRLFQSPCLWILQWTEGWVPPVGHPTPHPAHASGLTQPRMDQASPAQLPEEPVVGDNHSAGHDPCLNDTTTWITWLELSSKICKSLIFISAYWSVLLTCTY